MKKIFEHFEDMQDNLGTALAVIVIMLLIPVIIGAPFLWAWVYQQVWNYGLTWMASQFEMVLPTIGYWTAMGLYIIVRFIRSLFTVKVSRQE